MKETITKNDFIKAFVDAGRDEAWTEEGLGALYDYLVEYEESTGTKLELDVIAFDCEFCEYESVEEAAEDWGIGVHEIEQDALCCETASGSVILHNV